MPPGSTNHKMSRGKKLRAPEPFGSLIDKIRDEDRRFFQANPGVTWYVRDYFAGEFWPDFPNCAKVLVNLIYPWKCHWTSMTAEAAEQLRQAVEKGVLIREPGMTVDLLLKREKLERVNDRRLKGGGL